MRNVTYSILNKVGAVGMKKCTKEEYDRAPKEIRVQKDEFKETVYSIYPEVDEKDATLYLLAKQTKDIHMIRNILMTCFVLSIAGVVIYYIFPVLMALF